MLRAVCSQVRGPIPEVRPPAEQNANPALKTPLPQVRPPRIRQPRSQAAQTHQKHFDLDVNIKETEINTRKLREAEHSSQGGYGIVAAR